MTPRRLPLYLLTATSILLAAVGCPKRVEVKRPDTAGAALDSARAYLGAKRYDRAEDALTYVIFNFPGSRQASDAQYYLAESYYLQKDYTQAQTEYDFYIKSFPNGRFQEEATWRLGLAYFKSAPAGVRDQSRTLQAREMLTDFLLLYPESELLPRVQLTLDEIELRLTGRDFSVARLYHKGGEFRAALVYYEHIAADFEVERWEPIDRFRLAVCYAETGQTDDARNLLAELLRGDCEPELKRKARDRLARLD